MTYEPAKKLRRYVLIEDLRGDYQSQHQFLVRNHGNPKQCEQCGELGHKEAGGRWSIHWAKKKDREYTHDKNDYLQLCRKCHGLYDLTEEKANRLRRLAQNQTPEQLRKLGEVRSILAQERHRDKYGHFVRTTA